MLDVRRLRLLRELHARGTIAAVADALNFTPSAVSQQLALLERETGTALLERIGRRVALTDAAVRLVQHTDVVLDRLELAEAELLATDGVVHGTVRVAAFQTAAYWLVSPAIVRLAERYADLEVRLVETEAEEALPLLRRGELDLVVAEEYEYAPRPREPALERHVLRDDPIVLILPEGHPAARRKRVDLASLSGEVWASARAETRFADMLVRSCHSLGGFEPDIRYRANDIRLYTRLAAAGLAVSLAPALGRPQDDPGVAVRAVAGLDLERSMFVAARRGATTRPAVGAVLEGLREVALED